MRKIAVALLLLPACATTSSAPPLTAPQWDAVPAGVVEALCQRLQMDAIATGDVTVVRTTQPLANAQSFAALAGPTKKRAKAPSAPDLANRPIPISFNGGSCAWRPIDARDLPKHYDEMVVEISAPVMNPFDAHEAGLFARVSLDRQDQGWYWIALAPQPAGWSPSFVYVLFK